jgi:hypothetical protein
MFLTLLRLSCIDVTVLYLSYGRCRLRMKTSSRCVCIARHYPKFVSLLHVPGFAWLRRRVLDLMIEFIEPLYNWLQQFTNHYLKQFEMFVKRMGFKMLCFFLRFFTISFFCYVSIFPFIFIFFFLLFLHSFYCLFFVCNFFISFLLSTLLLVFLYFVAVYFQ